MFQEIENETFSQRENRVLNEWEKAQAFKKSLDNRKSAPLFVFYDGPPFATGLPHYGHLLAGTIKDTIHRYKTMKGFYVPRRFGWDCHGLPVENEIEKSFKLSGAPAIEAFGIANFNEECRKIVLRYTEEWKTTVLRMGRWVDFDLTYRTMDPTFMESVWWVFKELYAKGLVYEGFKVMPYSAKLGTPLSNFEAGENYKDVDDPSLTIEFTLLDHPDTAMLAWTTTPWTLVSNLALMVGPDIEYVKIQTAAAGKKYILAAGRLAANFKEGEYEIIERYTGRQLEGWRYEPLFAYFAARDELVAFRIILEDSVSLEDGTGVVHCAPAFGETDFYAAQRANIALVCPVGTNGQFTEEIPEYVGLFVKDADKDIIKRLKVQGKVFRSESLRHRYPFCGRSDTPLIYKAVQTYFVAVEKFKDRMAANNHEIHWTPEHIKYGRFGKWLEGARDWAISRNRYWGTPIPIWKAADGEVHVIGSLKELEELTGKKVEDLHRHFVDDLSFEKNGKVFHRITEVFDCWFDAGSMPYAQNHYPFENRELFEANFPADFIAEGLDQTRGWFYVLTALSTALFDRPAFKNVIVNGLILAENGAKMSKRLRNYPDPQEVIQKYGADAIRLYMLDSPAVRAEDLSFSEKGVELTLRQFLIPLWNAYSFFITYARIYQWQPKHTASEASFKPEAVIDKWILSKLHELIKVVEEGMDRYDLNLAVKPFVGFIDQLTNWYIRRCRRRFWEEKATPDREQAFTTLYWVLVELMKIAAPFIPFLSDAIYMNLRMEEMPESVHICDYPQYSPQLRDEHLEAAMAAVQQVASLGHALRKEHKLKVRQPLQAAYIASGNTELIGFLKEQQHLIAEELNVKEVILSTKEEDYVFLKAKPNFRVLGKKVGRHMRSVQTAIDNLPKTELEALLKGGNIAITAEGETFELTPEDVQVERQVKEGLVASNEGEMTVALNTELTPALIEEALFREIVNKLNTMRREAGFAVTDRISVRMETTQAVKDSFEKYRETIFHEVLATSVLFEPCEGASWDLNGEPAKIIVTKTTI